MQSILLGSGAGADRGPGYWHWRSTLHLASLRCALWPLSLCPLFLWIDGGITAVFGGKLRLKQSREKLSTLCRTTYWSCVSTSTIRAYYGSRMVRCLDCLDCLRNGTTSPYPRHSTGKTIVH
eukprot:scaffold66652_cov64-Phaeocystis_antarctica.AAC.1